MPSSSHLGLGLIILIAAAAFEVAGDAVIRLGLRGRNLSTVLVGFLVLGSYGVIVNLLKQDFSRTLGTYVGVFAIASVLAGKLVFGDRVGSASWIGLGIILTGCMVIQYGTLPR